MSCELIPGKNPSLAKDVARGVRLTEETIKAHEDAIQLLHKVAKVLKQSALEAYKWEAAVWPGSKHTQEYESDELQALEETKCTASPTGCHVVVRKHLLSSSNSFSLKVVCACCGAKLSKVGGRWLTAEELGARKIHRRKAKAAGFNSTADYDAHVKERFDKLSQEDYPKFVNDPDIGDLCLGALDYTKKEKAYA